QHDLSPLMGPDDQILQVIIIEVTRSRKRSGHVSVHIDANSISRIREFVREKRRRKFLAGTENDIDRIGSVPSDREVVEPIAVDVTESQREFAEMRILFVGLNDEASPSASDHVE